MADPVAPSPVEVLRRWADSGATWRVVSHVDGRLQISMRTCTGDEEMQRLDSGDPELVAFVGERTSSED
ncbi:MAG: hypothetical protein L0H79_17825 [Intrasporangium sp.]|uniref:hypothetical protein n=1 Tax=Intrasporangium sp. TaxID=1925024 RepID=UPI0026493D11|nr:hypothetical protein [Intrasporangium sp.]MDN5797590.1 hypothetical protein [Intrasporangium sp.]